MKDEFYSVKDMITEMRKDFTERFDKVDEAQAHTNGDVSDLKIWRGYLTGAIGVIILLVLPLLVYVWNTSQQQKLTIDNYKIKYESINKDN